MKSFEQLARSAYTAHSKELYHRIGVNSRPWDDLANSERECWIAAAKQIVAEMATVH